MIPRKSVPDRKRDTQCMDFKAATSNRGQPPENPLHRNMGLKSGEIRAPKPLKEKEFSVAPKSGWLCGHVAIIHFPI